MVIAEYLRDWVIRHIAPGFTGVSGIPGKGIVTIPDNEPYSYKHNGADVIIDDVTLGNVGRTTVRRGGKLLATVDGKGGSQKVRITSGRPSVNDHDIRVTRS